MNLEKINKLTAHDMANVDILIMENLNSSVQIVKQLSSYIITGARKRIRPMIAISAARAVGYKGITHITIAALIEFIHTATLLHDDVIDESSTRRGKATANSIFGNKASILVGDFIYTRAFQMITSISSIKIIELISKAVNKIAEGEILQLMNIKNLDISEEIYMHIIYNKTASLFEVAAQCSGILSGCSKEQEIGLRDYGRYLGTAFQLIDDLLDYDTEDNKILSKSVGNDLNEGKLTIPLIHAMHNSSSKQMQMIKRVIQRGNGRHFLKPILETMKSCGSLEWTRNLAKKEVNKAITALKVIPDNPWRDALIELAHIIVNRS